MRYMGVVRGLRRCVLQGMDGDRRHWWQTRAAQLISLPSQVAGRATATNISDKSNNAVHRPVQRAEGASALQHDAA